MSLTHNNKQGYTKKIKDNTSSVCLEMNKIKLKPYKFALTVLHRENKNRTHELYKCEFCNCWHLSTKYKRQQMHENLAKVTQLLALGNRS